MTTKKEEVTTTQIEVFDEEELVTPRVVKRKGQPDRITANFKKRSTFRWIAFDSLNVDPIYQRNLRKNRAIKMAHNWNPEKMGVIVVNRRDNGMLYIVDGQHRYAALLLIENRPPRVYCEVFDGLTREEEARLFHDLDNERANLTAGASFKALLAAHDKQAISIQRAANNVGLTVDYDKGPVPGNIRAFRTLQEIHNRRDEKGLQDILYICAKAWPNSNHACSSEILYGLEIFLEKYGDNKKLDRERLISVLSLNDPRSIVNMGRIINTTLSSVVYPSVAKAIRNLYNRGMKRNRLPEPDLF